MASRNPLGKIKDLTKGAASVGMHVAGQATTTAVSLTSGVVGKLVGGKKPAETAAAPAPTAPEASTQSAPEPARKTPAKKAPAKKAPAKKVSTTEPVNVTEELGLDPAPVDQPAATSDAPDAGKPVTTSDAAADTEHVEATPADIAKAVAKKPAAARKSPAKKTTPGAKLPPRKKVENAEQAT